MQVATRVHFTPVQKKSQETTLTAQTLSDEALRNMPAPPRVNGLQWEMSSPQERRQLLEAEQHAEHAENPSHSLDVDVNHPMDRLAQIVQQYHIAQHTHSEPLPETTDTAASTSSPDGSTQSASEQQALVRITQQFQQRFADTAQDKEAFHALMEKTFGGQYDYAKAETIRQQTLEGDFSWMPEVQLVDGDQLADRSGTQNGGVGKGAYSADKDTVYLSRELLNSDPAEAENILTEEVGHAIDARINTSDAKGDEGDIFSRLVHGETISNAELDTLQQENDSGTIEVNGETVEVNGETVEVEFGLWKSIKKGFKKLTNGVKKVKDKVKKIKDRIKKLGQKFIDLHKKIGRSIEKGFKKAMQSKLLGNIMTVLQWVPIPIIALVAQIYNALKAGYMVYQGVKHKSLGMVFSGAAGFVGGAGKLAGAAGFTGVAAKAATWSGNLNKAALAHQAIGKKDLTAALSLVNGQVGANNPLKSTLNTATAASAAHDAEQNGDHLGAVSSGSAALQGVTGPKGDKVLQFVGENAGALSAANQAIKSGNYAEAGETLYKQYGGALSSGAGTAAHSQAPRGENGNTTARADSASTVSATDAASAASSGGETPNTTRSGNTAGADNDQSTSEAQSSPANLPSPAKPEPLDEAKTDTSTVQQAQQRSQSTTAALSGDDGIAEEKQKSGSSTGKDDQPRPSSPSVDTPEEGTSTQAASDKAAETSEESLGAFTKGVVAGDFYENDSWSATAGKIVGGIAPPADARDVAAAVTHIAQGKEGAWSDLGWSLVGSVPLVGDTIKAVGKGSDVARGATKASGKTVDDVAASGKTADEVGELGVDGVKNAGKLSQKEINLAKGTGKTAKHIAARKKLSSDFYEKQGMPKAKIEGHTAGIDFNKPVEVVELPKDKVLHQYQVPDGPQGNYYTEPGVKPSSVGISSKAKDWNTGEIVERQVNPYKTNDKVKVLQSSAEKIDDTWSIPGKTVPTDGGGTQYFTMDGSRISGN